MTDRKHITLTDFLQRISDAITNGEPFPVWVHCEISDIKTRANYAFLDLQEVDEKGTKLATSQAAVWSQVFHKVFSHFQRVTGQPLQRGMRVLLLVEATMSPQWGFRLIVKDIDPSWTLGDAEKNNEEIRKKLKEEGIWNKNKSLSVPKDFFKVAVICPEKSAGEGDFFSEANKLMNKNICHFTTYTSAFEGQNVLSQMVGALWKIKKDVESGIHYDAVCIIRGGGATTGFTWLNQYEIIKLVAELPVPVFSGIGHEKDTTLIDEVAFQSFGTPSKVIGAIIGQVILNAETAFNAWQEIDQLIGNVLTNMDTQIGKMKEDIFFFSENILNQAQVKIDDTWKECIGLGPLSTLSRGYCILKGIDNKSVTSVENLNSGSLLQILLKDGTVQVQAGEIKKSVLFHDPTPEKNAVMENKTDKPLQEIKKVKTRKDKQY